MTDFEGRRLTTELSQERIDDGETRALLERLTAVDLGEHMPTLGAIAEATGHSIQDVAAQLVAIRADRDPGLRRRVENLESIVLEHDDRLNAPTPHRSKPIVGPYGREYLQREDGHAGIIVVIALLTLVGGLLLFGLADRPEPKSTETCYASGQPIPCEFIHLGR